MKPRIRFVHNQERDAADQIDMYLHCEKCLKEIPPNTAPRDWARLNVGFTAHGIQIWCVRHDLNVDDITVRLSKPGDKPTRLECDECGKGR